ncbi:hypothetical protein FD755_025199, partial [Muntiacus reevesi]
MSSPDDEVSVLGAGFGSEHGEQTSGLEAGSAPRSANMRSGEGEGGDGFPDPEGFESEREVLEAGGPVLQGRERRPGSLADDQGDALQLADESVAAILQQLADLNVLGTRRYLSQESYAVGEVSALRDLEVRPCSRGGAAQRCGEAAQAEAGQAWGTLRKALRVGQAKLNSPEDPGNTPRRLHVQGRVNLLNVPGTCQSSAPQRLILVDTSPMKMQSVLWGKGNSLSSYPGVAVVSATAAASTGSGPRPTPRRKGAQEKKSLGDVSKPAVGRTFPSWGVPLLGRSKKYALIPWGAEESKHTGAGKKSMARWALESVAAMAVSGEENDPNRDPFPKGQPSPRGWGC